MFVGRMQGEGYIAYASSENDGRTHTASSTICYIHFWCKMTPYRSHSDPVVVLQTTRLNPEN